MITILLSYNSGNSQPIKLAFIISLQAEILPFQAFHTLNNQYSTYQSNINQLLIGIFHKIRNFLTESSYKKCKNPTTYRYHIINHYIFKFIKKLPIKKAVLRIPISTQIFICIYTKRNIHTICNEINSQRFLCKYSFCHCNYLLYKKIKALQPRIP